MTTSKQEIKSSLQRFADGNLADNARNLLNVLGYRSERRIDLEPNTADGFIAHFDSHNTMNWERALLNEWESIDLLFQLTEEEIVQSAQTTFGFERNAFDQNRYESYLFFALKLQNRGYTRTQLSDIVREINRLLIIPAMVLFQYGETLTLAVIDRRLHKRDVSKDVLQKVTLIKDINFANPHRAHIDILLDLSITALHTKHQFKNFPQLHESWKKTLDTEALNRQFYLRLFKWFNWAVSEARFPENEKRNLKTEQHVIRLITRLLFVWFIKEKGLVADELFDEREVTLLLKDYNRDTGDSYYRAVLQNLFFATLNTEIDERRFSKGKPDHRNFSVYRYRDQMNDPDSLEALFGKTPFINGGLFDCLDDFKGIRAGGSRIDCFSDEHFKKLSLPNRLFFGDDGLISLLTHYKFTVEESTPIEQEVALDPELLGKVFENLLAAYNPETGETKRKQTGSYYTPRPIVDYMVEEALIATLVEQVSPTDGDVKLWDERLHYLLDYAKVCDDASDWFDEVEIHGLVEAISELKILDPAVGSGAFPMGMLHKLTLALRRLDSDNIRWEQLQRDRAGRRAQAAFKISNQQARDDELKEISDTFERYRNSDFGRKLYLIQNSIFGVDVQPEACQIAKLRFFISLAIDQVVDETVANFGIKPLPNLETRFVAANTLVGLQLTETRLLLQEDAVRQLIKEIEGIREKYYLTNKRRQKLHLEELEDERRERLQEELESQRAIWVERQKREIERKVAQLPKSEHRQQLLKEERKKYKARKNQFDSSFQDARKIARWKPYDQNKEADWFDPEWMFGIADGFNVVIGNPPYIESRNSLLSDKQKIAYGNQVKSDWGVSLPRGSDLLIYFYARSAKLLDNSGNGCFITQNAWLNTDYGYKFQRFSLNRFSFTEIVDTSAKFFSDINSQNINAIITVFTNKRAEYIGYAVADADMTIDRKRTIKADQPLKWGSSVSMPEFYEEILSGMSPNSEIGEKISFGQGLNFRLSQLSDKESDLPIIVKSTPFVSLSADGKIGKELARNRKKRNKIPALIMPRGIGQRHYCTFNVCRAFSYSGVELYLPEDLWNTDMHYCLWLYLNSSFVWLFREITGRKNLGGGMLKAEATDMKMLPIAFDFDFSADARKIFHALTNREPLPVTDEVVTEEHLLIDEIVADYFGFRNRAEQIRATLCHQVRFRVTRAHAQK